MTAPTTTCPEHLTCDVCGDEACDTCDTGQPLDGCIHRTPWVCVACRFGVCDDCRGDLL